MKNKIVAKLERGHKWKGSIPHMYAEKLYLYPTDEEETLKINMTDKFLKELTRKVINKELINLQVNAQVRMGKSTIGILIGEYIFNLIKKYFPNEIGDEKYGMKNIARDDQEYTKKMRNPDLMFNVIVTDESNALEGTGENSTVEDAQKRVFSDVQAGRYIHRVSCSPIDVIDQNCDMRLEVRNRENGSTHCRWYYKLIKAGNVQWILLGYVDLNVDDLIKNWKRLEKRFYRYLKDKNERDAKYIDHWKNRDYYVEYMVRKYEKMELMNREGILRPRELDYAGIVLNVVTKLKELTKIMTMAQIRLPVQSYVEIEYKKQRIPVSMIGIEMASRRVTGLLSLYKTLEELFVKKRMLIQQLNKNRITENMYKRRSRIISKNEDEVRELIDIQESELKRYNFVKKKYEVEQVEDGKDDTHKQNMP